MTKKVAPKKGSPKKRKKKAAPKKEKKPSRVKIISAGELADILGVKPSRVSVLLNTNSRLRKICTRPGRNWQIPKTEALKIIKQDRDPQQDGIQKKKAKGKKQSGKQEDQSQSFQEARAEVQGYKARAAKMDLDEREGTLISAALVEREAVLAGVMIKETLNAGKSRIAPLVAAESSVFECEQILQKEFDLILNKLSDMTYEAGFK